MGAAGLFGRDTGGDAGLFGPGSVTWRVHADPIMWVAGLRALLLQAVHPAAMAGVLQHSSFRADPWGRLLRTADYVGVVSYGSRADVAAVGERVRRIHAKISGIDPASKVRYRATDPVLLTWVHCCEVESFLTTYQRAGGGLTPDEVERYYAEQTDAAAVVGIDPATVPASAAQMAGYFRAMRPALRADARARRLASYVLTPPMPVWATPVRPAWAGMAGLAVALLPRWTRRLYGLPGLPTTDVAATVAVRGLRRVMQAAPQRYLEGPHARAARERLAAQSVSGARPAQDA